MLANEAYLFVQMSIVKNHYFKTSLLDCVTSVTRSLDLFLISMPSEGYERG
ncbi:hypothetical protein [Nostoc sp.]